MGTPRIRPMTMNVIPAARMIVPLKQDSREMEKNKTRIDATIQTSNGNIGTTSEFLGNYNRDKYLKEISGQLRIVLSIIRIDPLDYTLRGNVTIEDLTPLTRVEASLFRLFRSPIRQLSRRAAGAFSATLSTAWLGSLCRVSFCSTRPTGLIDYEFAFFI